jgi:arylsulfatase A-like enzyme
MLSAMKRIMVMVAAAVALVALVVVAWKLGFFVSRYHRDGPPDVVLITLDTQRADFLSPYDPRRQTPAAQRLAERSTIYTRAMTPMPMTRPAHFSMFTSQYPRSHGVLNNVTALPLAAVTLPEVMANAGYQTGGFVGVHLLNRGSGTKQGFLHFEGTGKKNQIRADVVVPRAISWLEGVDPDKPLFLWLHVFDAHQPYEPPEEFRHDLDSSLAKQMPSAYWGSLGRVAKANGGDIPAPFFDHIKRLYAREIEYADSWLGRLLDVFDTVRNFDEALVILTADHGECFENGIFFEHADCLFDGSIKVPLIVHYPNQIASATDDRLISLLDLAPTIVEHAGIRTPPTFTGAALPDGQRDSVLVQQPYFPSVQAGNWRIRAIESVAGEPCAPLKIEEERVGMVTRDWKYLRRGADDSALYRMSPEMDEKENVETKESQAAEEMGKQLDAAVGENKLKVLAPQRINEDLFNALKALGYL